MLGVCGRAAHGAGWQHQRCNDVACFESIMSLEQPSQSGAGDSEFQDDQLPALRFDLLVTSC